MCFNARVDSDRYHELLIGLEANNPEGLSPI